MNLKMNIALLLAEELRTDVSIDNIVIQDTVAMTNGNVKSFFSYHNICGHMNGNGTHSFKPTKSGFIHLN